MQLSLLKSKILRAEVTEAVADYEGSLAIDVDYMERVGLLPYEKILVGNISNGERLETYAIPAPAGSRTFALNGAAAHKGRPGDLLVIMAFAHVDAQAAQDHQPKIIVLADGNQTILKERSSGDAMSYFQVSSHCA